jgi:hypothetical protein
MTGVTIVLPIVMAGPDPAIQTPSIGDWMPGSSPGMTGVATLLSIFMAGPDLAIQTPGIGDWMPGSSPVMTSVVTLLPIVMAGLDPAIQTPGIGHWMPGSSRVPGSSPGMIRGPGMTGVTTVPPGRHGRARPGHPDSRRWRLDARIKSGHDAVGWGPANRNRHGRARPF